MDRETEISQNLREKIRARRNLRAAELKKELEELRTSSTANVQSLEARNQALQAQLESVKGEVESVSSNISVRLLFNNFIFILVTAVIKVSLMFS